MKIRLAILIATIALWAAPAMAQGCAMCYATAAGSTKEGQIAISRAVMVLLIPPVGFMSIGIGLALRYGKKRDDEQNSPPQTQS